MSTVQNRFALSALSKKYKNKSVPTEIMIDKETGEIQVKSEDGNVISYNYLSRLNAHIDTFVFNSYNADLYGIIYELENSSLDTPCTVNKDTNLIDSNVLITNTDFKAFMISIDLDIIKPNTVISRLDTNNVPIELEIQYTQGSSTKVMKISEPINIINRLRINKAALHVSATNPTIKSIKIGNSSAFRGDEKFILHSILLNVE